MLQSNIFGAPSGGTRLGEERHSEDTSEHLAEFTAGLLRRKVDVITASPSR